jgi:hypothetical protein
LALALGNRRLSSSPIAPATLALGCVRARKVGLTSNKTSRPLRVLHDGIEDTERHLHTQGHNRTEQPVSDPRTAQAAAITADARTPWSLTLMRLVAIALAAIDRHRHGGAHRRSVVAPQRQLKSNGVLSERQTVRRAEWLSGTLAQGDTKRPTARVLSFPLPSLSLHFPASQLLASAASACSSFLALSLPLALERLDVRRGIFPLVRQRANEATEEQAEDRFG